MVVVGRVVVGLQLPVQSVPITTKVVRLNPAHGAVYSIQHYVLKFVNDLRQVGGFLRLLQFPPPIKLTTTITENGVKHQNPKPSASGRGCLIQRIR